MSLPELSKRGRIVVLIVDDADGLLARTRRALLRAGIDVETATSGPQAMTALSGRPFDLVVLEVGPREVRTSELLREIRSLDHVAVMLVAGREPDADGTRGVDAQVEDDVDAFGFAAQTRVRALLRRAGRAYGVDGRPA